MNGFTFSVPLTMKYPPQSYGHSFFFAISAGDKPASVQFELLSMIGILPIGRLFLTTLWFPLVYSMSTVTGAEYVMSLRRHSWGVVSLVYRSNIGKKL